MHGHIQQYAMCYALLGILVAAFGCSGEKLDAGSNGTSEVVGTGGGSSYRPAREIPEWPAPDACVSSEELPMVGAWDGYVEGVDTTFHVTILGASEAQGVCGSVVYGDAPPPPPATDPTIGYPPSETGYPEFMGVGDINQWQPMEGFAFTMLSGTVSGSRVRFMTASTELWRGWCALQTPASDGYGLCLPNMGAEFGGPDGHGGFTSCSLIDPETNAKTPVDCLRLTLCLGMPVCVCSDAECGAERTVFLQFDLAFETSSANGSMILRDGSIRSVRLSRLD